jgi:hypothetical protein
VPEQFETHSLPLLVFAGLVQKLSLLNASAYFCWEMEWCGTFVLAENIVCNPLQFLQREFDANDSLYFIESMPLLQVPEEDHLKGQLNKTIIRFFVSSRTFIWVASIV